MSSQGPCCWLTFSFFFFFLQAWFNYSSERFGPDGSEVQRLRFLARKRANMLIATQSRLGSNCRLFNDYTLISLCCKIKQIFCAGLSLVWLSYSWMLWPTKYNILENEVVNLWRCRLNFWNTITSFQIYVTPLLHICWWLYHVSISHWYTSLFLRK